VPVHRFPDLLAPAESPERTRAAQAESTSGETEQHIEHRARGCAACPSPSRSRAHSGHTDEGLASLAGFDFPALRGWRTRRFAEAVLIGARQVHSSTLAD
jgi:hypothetical protein